MLKLGLGAPIRSQKTELDARRHATSKVWIPLIPFQATPWGPVPWLDRRRGKVNASALHGMAPVQGFRLVRVSVVRAFAAEDRVVGILYLPTWLNKEVRLGLKLKLSYFWIYEWCANGHA